MDTVEKIRSEFETRRYVILRSVIKEPLVTDLYEHVKAMAEAGKMSFSKMVPGTPVAYGDPAMERLLNGLRPTLEELSGLELCPTFSFYRLYKKGDVLKRHRDRRACEISVSLNLGQEPAEPWPLWVEGPMGAVGAELIPGDGVLYRGVECDHWREAFTGEHLAQVFLHYVDRNGPYQELKFDRRDGLALDRPARRAAKADQDSLQA